MRKFREEPYEAQPTYLIKSWERKGFGRKPSPRLKDK